MRAFPTTANDLVTWRLLKRSLIWSRSIEWRYAIAVLLLFSFGVLSAKSYEALTWFPRPGELIYYSKDIALDTEGIWINALLNYGCTLLLAITGLSSLLLVTSHLSARQPKNVRALTIQHLVLYAFTWSCIVLLVLDQISENGTSYLQPVFWIVAIINLLFVRKRWKSDARFFNPANVWLVHSGVLVWLFVAFYSDTIGNWVDVIQ